jgi:SpoU rRNA methylase family enzyme
MTLSPKVTPAQRTLATGLGVAALFLISAGASAATYGTYNASNTVIVAQDISDAVTLDPQVAL